MKNILIVVFSIVFLSGCSDSSEEDANVIPDNYFYLKINGQVANAYTNGNNLYNVNSIIKKNDFITVSANYGVGFEWHFLTIMFTTDGKLINIHQESHSGENGSWGYSNFRDFPSNYFNVNIISLDETSNKIKVKLTGRIYLDRSDLTSESIELDADIDGVYTNQDNSNPNYIIASSDTQIFTMEQYGSAKINNLPWIARHEHTNGVFTSVDPYRIEIHFDQNAAVGSFPITSTPTANYLRFSKFNTTTLSYDYYNVTGNLAYSYREYHGSTYYSFIGTFSFTAVNPNNPSDVITVTDGNFRSFQQF